ncbi:MAG TPA: BMP family ABC transporter substrate-binding protein [Gaiellaceae bacterium]|nr:BMP family ABC transporter substrate-binding protein [Gaiellaceae bacterium]
MRKKRTLLLTALSVLLVAFGAASCGGDDNSSAGDTSTTESEVKVGLVTDTGGVDDKGFNQFSIAGLDKAKNDLGVKTRVYVSKTADDYQPNLTAASDDGNDLVISVGFLLAPSTITVAKQYPNISYAGVDHFYGPPGDKSCKSAGTCALPNTLGMQYPSQESGYLAGVVAALMSKTGTVSTVGGKKIPPVDNWIAGFQAAVKATKPGTKMLNAYSQDFEDLAKCKEIALDQIAHGSDVVFQVAGKCGLGAIDAACEKGKTAIGVDVDQSGQGSCVVTSALKPLESSVYDLIKAFKDGQFKGGTNAFYGVADLPDAQLLTDFHGDVPQSVKDAVDKAEAGLKDGSIKPPATLG